MIEMACPSCGRGGQVPPEKLHSRLVCRKCHVVFHMDPSGRPVIGEPHVATGDPKKKDKNSNGEHHSIFEAIHIPRLDELTHLGDNLTDYTFPVKPVLGTLGGLVVLWVMFSLFSRPPEPVSDRARLALQALTSDDLDRLKTFASEETRDDVIRWYDAIHPKLESARKSWPSKEADVQVVVIEEDPSRNRGEIEAVLLPAMSGTQTASVVPSVNSKNDKPALPLSFHMSWVWSGKHWWLDGHGSLAGVPQ